MKKFSKDISHYIPLLVIFILAVAGFVGFGYDKLFQAAVVVAAAFAYIVWGVAHHAIHDDLYLVVVLEYIAVAFLGLIIILSLIFSL